MAEGIGDFWVGTSGWSYDHWHDTLYPHGLPAVERLDVYNRHYETVEINSTFYRWPPSTAFARWRQRLPAGFLMSVKAPRGLTHGKRLYAPEAWLARITLGLRTLGEHRGPLLVQVPPQMECDLPRLDYFLRCLPPGQRTAMEFRHPSWVREEVFTLLTKYGTAYCVMSGAGLPCVLCATAPFVYVRLHGPDTNHLYAGSYSDDDLRWWAARIGEWRSGGLDVFAYFNNDGAGNAVRNADTLRCFVSERLIYD
jgi:uncharacterized protein YecE (DUF72 family)